VIILKAILRCDANWCNAEVEVKVELKPGKQGIPILDLETYPDEWGWGEYGDHCCPEHRHNFKS